MWYVDRAVGAVYCGIVGLAILALIFAIATGHVPAWLAWLCLGGADHCR